MTQPPQVIRVEPLSDFCLKLSYATGEVRIFDVKPWLESGMFKSLQVWSAFAAVRPFRNTVEWANGTDLDPSTLYADSFLEVKKKS